MTLALRLLRGYVGTGPAAPLTTFLISSTQGFWNTISEPVAHYYNGVTYLAWCDDSARIWAASYNHSTQTTSTPVNVGSITTHVDGAIHIAPSILVRSSDHRIMVFGVANGSGIPGYWLSTNPEDATAFGSVNLFSGTSHTYTYISVAQLDGVTNSPIYAFVKYFPAGTGNLSYFKSTDGGSTWAGPTQIMTPAATTSFYWRIGNDGNTRCDIFATTTDRVASPSSVYHFIFQNDLLYKSDGTTAGSLPVASNAGTLVQDSSLGSARSDGWAYSAGKPACLVLINSGGTTDIARVAVWTGSAWNTFDPGYDSNGFVGGNQFVGSGAMAKNDPYTIFAPVKVGSHFELYRYQSFDAGSTWYGQAQTSGSTTDNAMPDTPLNAAHGLQVVWGLGTYTSDSNFVFNVYGAGR